MAAQRDSESADIEKERQMQLTPESRAHELEELTMIYVNRGLCHETAKQVGAPAPHHRSLIPPRD